MRKNHIFFLYDNMVNSKHIMYDKTNTQTSIDHKNEVKEARSIIIYIL